MPAWITNEMLYYGGIAAMAVAGLAAVAAIVLFIVSGKRLRSKLRAEYGEKKR